MRNLWLLYVVFFSSQAFCQKSYAVKVNLGTTYYVGNNALSKSTNLGLIFGTDIRFLKLSKFSFYFTPEMQRLSLTDKAYFGNTKTAFAVNASICTSYDAYWYKKTGIEPFIGFGFHYLKHQICERAFQITLGSIISYNINNNFSYFAKFYYQNNSYNYPYINNPDNNLFKSSHSMNLGIGFNL